MNKYMRKIMALTVAGLVTFGMGTPVLAENGLNTSDNPTEDTSQITLDIDYQNGSANQQNTVSPAENFTLTIDRYGLWNVGEDGSGNPKYTLSGANAMPTFTNGATTDSTNTFTINASAGAAGSTTTKLSKTLTVPTYKAVGDYWYKVTETNNNVAGVFYGTNDNVNEDTTEKNGKHMSVYYLHVQVINNNNKSGYIRSVTLHKTAPGATLNNTAYESWYDTHHANADNQQDKKVSAIQNKYFAGSLNITKNVEGNAGDKNELFMVTVTFTNTSKANMNSAIKYYDFYDAKGNYTDEEQKELLNWTDDLTNTNNNTKEVSFYVKDGTTVHFDNIPYGVKYEVSEKRPDDDKYTHTFSYGDTGDSGKDENPIKFNGIILDNDTVTPELTTGTAEDKWKAANATGTISDDSDTVTITNTKTSAIDVGVFTSNAPYIAMLVVAGMAVVVYLRKKRIIKE